MKNNEKKEITDKKLMENEKTNSTVKYIKEKKTRTESVYRKMKKR